MGYTYRNNGKIKDFWPDDDDNTIYISYKDNLSEIIKLIHDKWGEHISLDDISIEAERIHTECLTYDLYDPSDYTDFIVVRRM